MLAHRRLNAIVRRGKPEYCQGHLQLRDVDHLRKDIGEKGERNLNGWRGCDQEAAKAFCHRFHDIVGVIAPAT